MNYIISIMCLLLLLSCGKGQETSGTPHQLTLEQVVLTELPESHFLPFKLDSIQVVVEKKDSVKTYIADNKRNKILSYYQGLNQKLKDNKEIAISDIEWALMPLLNIKDRERIKDTESAKSINSVKLKIPNTKNVNTKYISYSIRILDENRNIITKSHYEFKDQILFSINPEQFMQIFINEKWQIELSVKDIVYNDQTPSWNDQRTKRAEESFLSFTLNPQSILYEKTETKQYNATLHNPTFLKREDVNEPLREASITLTLPELPVLNKNFFQAVDKNAYFQNLSSNHLYFSVNFKQKNYKLKNNKKNVFVSYSEYSCETSSRGEPVNCKQRLKRGSCDIEWTSLEPTPIKTEFNEKQIKEMGESIIINDSIVLYSDSKNSYISKKQQSLKQEIKFSEKLDSLKISYDINHDSYKTSLKIDKSKCMYNKKAGLKFIDKDSWLNNHEKEVYLKEITPIIEFSEIYR